MNRAYSRIALIAYLLCVFYLLFGRVSASEDIPRLIAGIPVDKLAHFAIFFPFPALFWFSFRSRRRETAPNIAILCSGMVLGVLFGASTELVQSFIPYRSADMLDLLCDCLGIVAGTLTMAAFYFIKRK